MLEIHVGSARKSPQWRGARRDIRGDDGKTAAHAARHIVASPPEPRLKNLVRGSIIQSLIEMSFLRLRLDFCALFPEGLHAGVLASRIQFRPRAISANFG
jgi:hypothetical protein